MDNPAPQTESRNRSRALPLLLGLFFLVANLYAATTPPFESPDEIWHFAFIQQLAEGGGLPISEPNTRALWRQQGVQAPGYYLAGALLTSWIDQSDFPSLYGQANPHAAIGRADLEANRNYLLHIHDTERFPWSRSILALHITRIFSTILATITLLAIYRLIALLVDHRAGLLGAALIAATPQFLFISGSASNDNAINLFAALVLLALTRMLLIPQQQPGPSRRAHLLLGVLLGFALLSKLSALALVGLSGLVILWIGFERRSLRPLLMALPYTGLPTLLIAGWWYLRNWVLYEDFLAWNVWRENILLRVAPAGLETIVSESGSLFRSYWGLFGWMNLPYPEWVYVGFSLLSLFVLIGLGLAAIRWLSQRPSISQRKKLARVLPLLWFGLLTISWLRFMRIAPAAQGRYFFAAAGTIGLLFVIGSRDWGKYGERLAWGGVTLLSLLSVCTPFWLIRPAYSPPPLISTPSREPVASFGATGPSFHLLDAQISHGQLKPGDTAEISLLWQSVDPGTVNYSIFVHLVDEIGVIVAQSDSFPAGGLLATSTVPPGSSFGDRHHIRIPDTVYTPSRGRVVVGIYDPVSRVRVPLSGDDPGQDGEAVTISEYEIERAERAANPNPMDVRFEEGVHLVGYEMNRRVIEAGDTLELSLFWMAEKPLDQPYVTFVHLLDEEFNSVGGHDGEPAPGTTEWVPGTRIEDRHQIQIGADAPAGLYRPAVGLYSREGIIRLRLEESLGAEGADRLLLGPLRVQTSSE